MKYLELLVHDNTIQISGSSQDAYTTCPRKFLYYKLLRRTLAAEKSALSYGKAIHAALEVRYRSNDPIITDTLEAKQVTTLSKSFEGIEQVEGDFRTLDRAIDTIKAYNKQYPTEMFEVAHLSDGKPATEVKFLLPLGKINDYVIMWKGIIDAVIMQQDQYWILEHKTTSMLGSTYFANFYNATATIGYCWAGQQLFNKPFRGVMINALCGRKPSKTGVAVEFARENIYYDPAQIEEWQHNVLDIVRYMIMNATYEAFPMHTANSCVGKYGKCEYFDVCTLPPNQRETMLMSNAYKDAEASPLEAE